MEARFCRIVLQHVDKALLEEPSRDGLLGLLQIADPDFTEADLADSKKRDSTRRTLNLLIHPDKHPGDKEATQRFQNTRAFFDKCIQRLSCKKRKFEGTSAASCRLPLQFHMKDKWPFLATKSRCQVAPTQTLDAVTLEKIISFQCINDRGAIAHGKRTALVYNAEKREGKSVLEVFCKYGGGSKSLGTIESIKEEIMTKGPVVSSSFRLTKALLNAGDHAQAFETTLVDKRHPLLIVGWEQTAYGQMWLVESAKKDGKIPLAMGQYSLEDNVTAPCSDFMNEPWQSQTKTLEVDKLPEGWYLWTCMTTRCSTGQIEDFFAKLGCSLATALNKKTPFVVSEKERIARSRYAYLTDMEWEASKKGWNVTVKFCDQKWED